MGETPLPLFTAEQIKGRFVDLWDIAERFQRSYSEKLGLEVTINERRLYLIVISTYDDITRYKFYHLSKPYEERSDAVKRASYLAKWITRFKPCHVVGSQSEDSIESLLVNEIFAVSVAIANLNHHCKKDFYLSIEKEYELVYDLMYRTLSDDALMLFYKAVVDIVEGTTFIEMKIERKIRRDIITDDQLRNAKPIA